MTRFDWRFATAWTLGPVCLGLGFGLLTYGLWLALDRLRTGSYTREALIEILVILVVVLAVWWGAAVARGVTARHRRAQPQDAARRTRRVVVIPPRSPVA